MLIGYARVSTEGQNLDRQLDQLKEFGVKKIYKEKITGTKKDRPELNKLLEYAREEDVIVVTDLTRISRSTKDLINLFESLKDKGIHLKSLKESWIDTTCPQGQLMFTIFAGISQFERDLISQRTKEGLQASRARGRKGGRPKKDNKSITTALKLYNSKQYSLREIKKMTGVSSSTLYRYINKDK